MEPDHEATKVQWSGWLPVDIYHRMCHHAQRVGISKTAVIVLALRQYLKAADDRSATTKGSLP